LKALKGLMTVESVVGRHFDVADLLPEFLKSWQRMDWLNGQDEQISAIRRAIILPKGMPRVKGLIAKTESDLRKVRKEEGKETARGHRRAFYAALKARLPENQREALMADIERWRGEIIADRKKRQAIKRPDSPDNPQIISAALEYSDGMLTQGAAALTASTFIGPSAPRHVRRALNPLLWSSAGGRFGQSFNRSAVRQVIRGR
ncbi:MAG: hypothetical protein Q7T11_03815, partial [Deltaproteobacteria bacterium]|nr:hypothetical protein [Deltaproteobacteria bacterium]